MSFSIIAAVDQKNGIGKGNQIPWYLSGDFKFFAKTTRTTHDPSKQNAVIMGKNTWDSLPEKYKPLPDRLNVVLVKTGVLEIPKSTDQFNTFYEALEDLGKNPNIENIFVIGGSMVYETTIKHPDCKKIYLTRIETDFECDKFFPEIPEDFKLISESKTQAEDNTKYKYLIYERK